MVEVAASNERIESERKAEFLERQASAERRMEEQEIEKERQQELKRIEAQKKEEHIRNVME